MFNRKLYMKQYNRENRQRKLTWYKVHRQERLEYNYKNREKRTLNYKRYRKTFKGFILCRYKLMKARFLRKTKIIYPYLGKGLISKNAFIKLAKNSKIFQQLYKSWVKNNYILSLTPTVDRIDPVRGYVKSNIQFLSYKENHLKYLRGE